MTHSTTRRPYFINNGANEYEIYPYDQYGKLYNKNQLMQDYPLLFNYISNPVNKEILLRREDGRFSYRFWQYSRPQNMQIMFKKKLLTPFNAFHSSFALDLNNDFLFSAGVSGAYGVLLKKDSNICYEYLLGLLNSRLLYFYIINTSTCLRGHYYSFEKKYIKNLPIYIPAFTNKNELFYYNEIVRLVTLIINRKKGNDQSDTIENENKIEKIVYKLYGITHEEVKIIDPEFEMTEREYNQMK